MPGYLCGAKDDSIIVLSSAGSFLLLSTETDGHWTEAIVHAEEILVFCDDNTVINTPPVLGLKYEDYMKIIRVERGAEWYYFLYTLTLTAIPSI